MQYPNGAIKTYKELCDARGSTIYGASREFCIVEVHENISALRLAAMLDHNIEMSNGYNDWFLFADRQEADAYAEGM